MRVNFILVCLILLRPVGIFAERTMTVAEINQILDNASVQAICLYNDVKSLQGKLPRSVDKQGKLVTSTDKWWTSGFFPGTLWYLYEYSGKEEIKQAALEMTERVRNQQFTTDNHDVGFMIYCSYGNALRLTGNNELKDVIINAAKSLSSRYNPITGTIKSWDNRQWQYPVIIDNMMNLELLTQATKISGDSSFYRIAVSHADTTMKYHFRPNGSSYHVVNYDTIRGGFLERVTFQGFSNESSWARGQAWGLYGFVMMYRETGKKVYLDHAVKIADYILNHPNMPDDKIPYWDFNAPDIPNALRDASAGAVIASALIELSTLTGNEDSVKYLESGACMLKSLSAPPYLAAIGDNGHFILKHSVGFFARNSEIDVPLTYADYYFLEALTRIKKIKMCMK
jgi:unsaturated chondroitin disaccharide hydrolase